MRWRIGWSLSLSLVALSGCPKPPEPDTTPPPRTADAGAPPTHAALARPAGCETGPGWLGLEACQGDGVVYATGVAEKITNPALASATASNHARAALVKLGLGTPQADGSVELRESEVLDSFACNDATYALARLRAAPPPATPLPACVAEVLQGPAPSSGDCPDWTRKGAWREGDDIIAVGVAAGLKNPAMAANVAKNRAMAEAQKLVALSLKVSDTGVTTRTEGTVAFVPADVETARCSEVTFSRVTFRAR